MKTSFALRDLFPDNTSFNFLRLSRFNFYLSIFFLLSITVCSFFVQPNYGIDFKGGVLLELRFNSKPSVELVRHHLNLLKLAEFSVQSTEGNNDVLIKTSLPKGVPSDIYIASIKNALHFKGNKFEVLKAELVGAEIGKRAIYDGLLATFLTLIGISVYVFLRFSIKYAASAFVGLLYCLLLTFGLLRITPLEFNLTSVAALLTVLGYSVNDIVVIFDRVRQNLKRYSKIDATELLNISINETLSRTIFTVATMLIASGALILFGPDTLFSFSVIVFVGVIIGTYCSVFICVPMLKVLGKKV